MRWDKMGYAANGLIALLLLAPLASAAEEPGDIMLLGIELEKALNLFSGVVALALLFITYVAFRRTRNSRLLYVSGAFLLFVLKGFLTSIEMFGPEIVWADPVASLLNFAIILCFFFGVVKRS
jgi:hypothetical protein